MELNRDMGPVRIRTTGSTILVQVRGDHDSWTTVGTFDTNTDSPYTHALECAQRNFDNIKRASVVSHGLTLAPGTSVDNLSV